MDWVQGIVGYVPANAALLRELIGNHLLQSILPIVFGVLIAVPLAQVARLSRAAGAFLLTASSLLYTIPSLAMFVFLPLVLGTSILSMINVVVALTIYAVALLMRSTVDALNSIDDGVRQAAVAMGYTPLRRFLTVDLPLAVPVLIAGVRVISVTNISMVSVGALIGVPSLGRLFTDGLTRNYPEQIAVGILATLLLALVLDLLLVLLERMLTPWARASSARSARAAALDARTVAA
ncbi:ABC transporter permease subunit [Vibrio cholerae]|jgi:osmoprotectant transport system permease protein|nr:ABC transporter permease subunit [Vibrio cholerae]